MVCEQHERFEEHIKEGNKFRDRVIKNEVEIEYMKRQQEENKKTINSLIFKMAGTMGGINIMALIAMVMLK